METKILINKKSYIVTSGEKESLIYQYVGLKGSELPCFCYSEPLSVAGNCRMCLVEIEGVPKLIASCAVPIQNGMSILTKTKRLSKARESVLELLLINHPLDCPVCDQGGECDLQDLTREYGSDRGRYYEYVKRAVIDKDAGVFIKTIMTRCIHCTRCIRFFSEIAGQKDFGLFGRGELSEITMWFDLLHPLSGNVVDICPVGALTSKPYAYNARPWELTNIESIDLFDSLGSAIKVDLVGTKVVRILPINQKSLNDDWLTNKARYFFDMLKIQRLTYPFFFEKLNIKKLNWVKTFEYFLSYIFYSFKENFSITYVPNTLFDLDTAFVVKNFFSNLGLNIQSNNVVDYRQQYLFLTSFKDFYCFAHIVLINVNLRAMLPLLTTKLRQYKKKTKLKISNFGCFNFDAVEMGVGNNVNSLLLYLNKKKIKSTLNVLMTFGYNKCIEKANNLLIVGEDSFSNWIFNYPSINITRIVKLNYKLGPLTEAELNFGFHRFSNVNIGHVQNVKEFINIYIGSFFDDMLKSMDLILPSLLAQEDNKNYINLFGTVRYASKFYSNSNIKIKREVSIWKVLQWYIRKIKFNSFRIIPNNIGMYFAKLYDLAVLSNIIFLTYLNSVSLPTNIFVNTIFIKNSVFTTNELFFYTENSIMGKSKILNSAYQETKKYFRVFDLL